MTDHDQHHRTQADPPPGGEGCPQESAGRDSKKCTYTHPMFSEAEKDTSFAPHVRDHGDGRQSISVPYGPIWDVAWLGEHVWRSGVGTPEGLI